MTFFGGATLRSFLLKPNLLYGPFVGAKGPKTPWGMIPSHPPQAPCPANASVGSLTYSPRSRAAPWSFRRGFGGGIETLPRSPFGYFWAAKSNVKIHWGFNKRKRRIHLKILFTGGGTAGHVNPALAMAEYMRKKDPSAKFLFVGSVGGIEKRLAEAAGLEFVGVRLSGFSRELSFSGLRKNIQTVTRVFAANATIWEIVKKFDPDLCVGEGGYVTGPVLREAKKMGYPVVLHEPNAYPGLTSRLLARNADCVMLASERARKFLPKRANVVFTGNPVLGGTQALNKHEARQKLGLDERPVVLSFGGSLGSTKLNEATAELLVHSAKNEKLQHVHAYGTRFGKDFLENLRARGVDLKNATNLHVSEYISNMPQCLAAADVAVCRAGSTTLSELQAAGCAAILVPSPNVAENHQYHNAMSMVEQGAAVLLEEKDLSGEVLQRRVEELLKDTEKLEILRKNAKKMADTGADEKIFEVLKKYARK